MRCVRRLPCDQAAVVGVNRREGPQRAAPSAHARQPYGSLPAAAALDWQLDNEALGAIATGAAENALAEDVLRCDKRVRGVRVSCLWRVAALVHVGAHFEIWY